MISDPISASQNWALARRLSISRPVTLGHNMYAAAKFPRPTPVSGASCQARTAVVELQRQSTREEKTRRGTYTAGGRRDDEQPGTPGAPATRT